MPAGYCFKDVTLFAEGFVLSAVIAAVVGPEAYGQSRPLTFVSSLRTYNAYLAAPSQ
jgi:hypothetical protein